MVKIAIFHRYQGFQQERRHLINVDQNAVFKIFRVETTDQQWLKAHYGQLGAIGGRQFGNVITGETHTHRLGFLGTFIKLEPPGIEVNRVAID